MEDQLQLFFDGICDKSRRLRQISAGVRSHLEGSKEWTAAQEAMKAARTKVNLAKARATAEIEKDLEEIDRLRADLADEMDKAAVAALVALKDGRIVVLERDGKKYDTKLKIQFRRAKDAGEAEK